MPGTWNILQPGARDSLHGKASDRTVLPEATMSGKEVVRPAENQESTARARKGATKASKYDITIGNRIHKCLRAFLHQENVRLWLGKKYTIPKDGLVSPISRTVDKSCQEYFAEGQPVVNILF